MVCWLKLIKLRAQITEYFYQFGSEWSLVAFAGNTPEQRVVLQGRSGAYEIVSTSKELPRPTV